MTNPDPDDPTLLSLADFETMYSGSLSASDQAVLTRLMRVASRWILGKKPDVDSAQFVLFELGRDEVQYGNYRKLSSFQDTTSRRTEAGVFDREQQAIDDLITDRQKQMLGIDPAPSPALTVGDGHQTYYIGGPPYGYYGSGPFGPYMGGFGYF